MTIRVQPISYSMTWSQPAINLLNQVVEYINKDASTTDVALLEVATNAEATAATATDKALVPSNFSGKAAVQTYTEGAFTPVLTFGGGSTGITYSVQSGVYTRVGRLVHVEIVILLTSKGSSTGAAVITGLPLTVGQTTAGASIQANSLTAGVGDTHLQAVFNGAATTMSLQDIGAGAAANLTDVDFTNTTLLRIAGVYRTSA